MGLRKLATKLADYYERLENGNASKINSADIEKVIKKLRVRATKLDAELSASIDSEKRSRLERKIAMARQHIKHAEWLLKEIG
jgi:uncharacterized protein YaiL (DUF2058 family)